MTSQLERELLAFGARLSARFSDVAAPADFRVRLRRTLLAATYTESARASFTWPAMRSFVAAMIVLALLAGSGGVAAAASSSLPGDPAFAIKRGVEQVQVALAADEVARLDLLVAQADARLADLETLIARDSSAVDAAAAEYLAAASRVDAELGLVTALPGSDQRDAALALATTKSAAHLASLEALATRLPDAAQQGIQRAIQVQEEVHGKAPARPTIPIKPTRGGPPTK